ncbi:hypothetical protein [Streptomyces sp. NBC_00838]|uniref:hypothetical protein n=1 Tax=Streptomyces sp. NBC_00838 TaxID=2903680 RepID=UPI00386A123A
MQTGFAISTVLTWGYYGLKAWSYLFGRSRAHPADLARYLGLYAERVMTPRGTTATTGLELMVALRPPTRAQKDEATGEFRPALNDGALTAVYPHVECEELALPDVPWQVDLGAAATGRRSAPASHFWRRATNSPALVGG